MDFLLAHLDDLLSVAEAASVLLLAVAAITPTQSDDSVAHRVANLVAILRKLRGPK